LKKKISISLRARQLIVNSFPVVQVVFILFLHVGWQSIAIAQGLQYEVGRTATEQEINDWDRTLDPSGNEVPDGRGTASGGEIIYQRYCQSCHGTNGINGRAPELTGYLRIYPIQTWDKIYRTMPLSASGTGEHEVKLSPDEVYALTAYILYLNGMAAENDVIDKQNLPAVRIPDPDLIH
jgi:mono/diheme cytochrome c family protein